MAFDLLVAALAAVGAYQFVTLTSLRPQFSVGRLLLLTTLVALTLRSFGARLPWQFERFLFARGATQEQIGWYACLLDVLIPFGTCSVLYALSRFVNALLHPEDRHKAV